MSSFCISKGETNSQYGLFSTVVFHTILMQNEDIWNFHGSLTLNKGKGIRYSGSLWYPIASNMTNFLHSFRKKEKIACFGLSVSPVLRENEDIWNFHGSLTLNKGKLI